MVDIMEYRLGNSEDIDNIRRLIKASIREMEDNGIFQWDELYPNRADFEEDIRKKSLYVVMDGNILVAIYVICKECDDEYLKCCWDNPDKGAYILHRFCISPDYQNKGIGKQVLLNIEEQIRKMGYSSVRLDVYSENPYALRLYEHNGYIKKGFADWRKGRFYLMEKQL